MSPSARAAERDSSSILRVESPDVNLGHTAVHDGGRASDSGSDGFTVRSTTGRRAESDEHPPGSIVAGRYRVLRTIGYGGFGDVLLVLDQTLGREVAMKLPRTDNGADAERMAEAFLAEARTLAEIDHPNVLPVYDFGRTPAGRCYLVSKFIAGHDLASLLPAAGGEGLEGDPLRTVVEILAEVCEALTATHRRGVVHRDVKPENVLVDAEGRACLADFGLALRDEAHRAGRPAGTVRFMSPEQCRGEHHLVDGRSDIFSVGVLLYRALCGRFPFDGSGVPEIMQRIVCGEFRPPRQWRADASVELSRICERSLQPRAADRYAVAADMAGELREWLAEDSGFPAWSVDTDLTPPVGPPSRDETALVPRGLQAFRRRDAAAFLRLLPGPRCPSGLPDGVEHWVEWASRAEGEPGDRVGVVVGPSGSGKSSIVRAGVLPNLPRTMRTTVVEARAGRTARSLRRSLAKLLGDRTPSDLDGPRRSAPQMAHELRSRTTGGPTLIVFDQFEQWLATPRRLETSEVALTLRQCDGVRLKALILVRDEFWLPLSRLLAFLEVPFDTGDNAASVDLFDRHHAETVLREFGVAYGRLPQTDLSETQRRFLQHAVAELAASDGVYPVRLALFAEMFKGRDWTPAELRASGGADGVGVRFLEQTFEGEAAETRCRRHAEAAARVLDGLLPGGANDLRGPARSLEDMAADARLDPAGEEFRSLVSLLRSELRLITLTAEEGGEDGDRESPRYQLAHDYLVPSVREWLRRRRRRTLGGRTRLVYADCLEDWRSRRSAKSLPTLWEWLRMRLLLRRRDVAGDGRAMLRAADRRHGLRMLLAAAAVLSSAAFAGAAWERHEASMLADRIMAASPERLAGLAQEADGSPRLTADRLAERVGRTDASPLQKLTGMTVLERLGRRQPGWPAAMLSATPGQRRTFAAVADPSGRTTGRTFARVLADAARSPEERLAAWQVADPSAFAALPEADRRMLVDRLLDRTARRGGEFNDWAASLAASADDVLPYLAEASGPDRTPEAVAATSLTAAWCEGRPGRCARFVLAPWPWHEPEYRRLAKAAADADAGALRGLVRQSLRAPELLDDAAAGAAARAAALLSERGEAVDLPRILARRPQPALRVAAVSELAASAIEDVRLAGRLEAALGGDDPATAESLLQVLAARPAPGDGVRDAVSRAFRESPDPGVHASAELCLANWDGVGREVLPAGTVGPGGRWRVNAEGQTLVRLPESAGLDYPLEVMAREVTVDEFLRWDPSQHINREVSLTGGSPANVVTYPEAVAYARWLTTRCGMTEADQYHADDDGPADTERLRAVRGYRLLTIEEALVIAAGGVETPYRSGETPRRLADLTRFGRPEGPAAPALSGRPNAYGVFHPDGNMLEWTQTAAGNARHLFGGSYGSPAEFLRLEPGEATTHPGTAWNRLGFRLVRTATD